MNVLIRDVHGLSPSQSSAQDYDKFFGRKRAKLYPESASKKERHARVVEMMTIDFFLNSHTRDETRVALEKLSPATLERVAAVHNISLAKVDKKDYAAHLAKKMVTVKSIMLKVAVGSMILGGALGVSLHAHDYMKEKKEK